ncbi:MAG: hypothetical protein JW924_14570, partial [Fusobacteriaceae bacterium]|nr:hypothetical protein [Fusobacteriaceae bacterium]
MKNSKKYFVKKFKKWSLFNAIPLFILFIIFFRDRIYDFESFLCIGFGGVWMATIPLYFLENLQFKKIVQWFLFGIVIPLIIFCLYEGSIEDNFYMVIVSNPITYFMFSSVYNYVTPEIISDFKEKRYFKL